MDTSNKINFILGHYSVPRTELDSFDWLEITREILNICKPYLKYFPDFKPIRETLSHSHEYDSRTTDESIIDLPDGISLKTRGIYFCLERKIEGELGQGSGSRYINEKNLFLTQEGQWLILNSRYERVPQYGLGYRSHRSGIKEVVLECRFSTVSEEELITLFKYHPTSETDTGLGANILTRMCYLVQGAIKERKARLNCFLEINEKLAGIYSSIE